MHTANWRDAYRFINPRIDATGVHVWPFERSFPLEIHFWSYERSSDIRMNRHDYFELILMEKGNAVFQIQDRSVAVKEGDLFIVGSTLFHRLIYKGERLKAPRIMFLPELICPLGAPHEDADYLLPFLIQDGGFPHVVPVSTGIPKQVRTLMDRIAERLPAESVAARLCAKTSGSRLYDVDGNQYIDYALAHGPLILGHCHPRIVSAVERQVRRGSTYGCQHPLEPAVAEKILTVLPWADKIIFSSTGTEAVQVALRIARAATGRTLIVKFEGHYHGWADSVLIGHRHKHAVEVSSNVFELLGSSGQSASVLNDILVLPWNNPAALESVFHQHGDRIAAVIAEPVPVNTGSILPQPGYLQLMREITSRHRAALIFDEVITGFRLAPGGASEYFAVAPDLAVFAKAIAGGYPLSAVAGSASVMSPLENGKVRHLGTFNANPIVMAAAAATLDVLFDPTEDIYATMMRNGTRLFKGLQAMSSKEVPILLQGLPVCFHTLFTRQAHIRNYSEFLDYNPKCAEAWQQLALAEGIFQMGDARWYLSGVHTEDDITETLDKAERALQQLSSADCFLEPAAT